MSEQEIVAFNFKRLREERGWTQDKLASLQNVSQNYIAQIEGNHCDFGVRARKKWAKFFGIDTSEFFKIPPRVESSATSLFDAALEKEISSLRMQAMKQGPLGIENIKRIRKMLKLIEEDEHRKASSFSEKGAPNSKKRQTA